MKITISHFQVIEIAPFFLVGKHTKQERDHEKHDDFL